MNHDITHCDNVLCAAKNTCIRYQAYLELLKTPSDFPVSWHLHGNSSEKCLIYLPKENA